ncbi:MAG TPA: hypothetical protein VH042_10280 [Solirubrobacterales bacterium]|nr:hypothetical protein [Solirubrobacterales bacterium]
MTGAVAASTQWAFPPSNSWRTAVYVLIGVIVTLVVADIANFIQEKIHKVQVEIQNFLVEIVNTRQKRAAAVIDLCRTADREFRAVTFFPAVGVQDDPKRVPAQYLQALEEALEGDVDVTLVSVSCEEAKQYCTERGLKEGSSEALTWIESRLKELDGRFDTLTWITVPGDQITINVCHNESAALMYHMALASDEGSGFKSTDARIIDVAKGGFERYEEYNGNTV